MNQKILLNNEDETKEFAVAFSRKLKKGDVLELIGDLGSGKTFFTRALAESMGASNISSPSFVIRNQYMTGRLPIIHFDFYRLENPEIIGEELGEDIKTGESLIIVEWADSVNDILPASRYKIFFKVTGDNSRELSINR